jgi:hypothetical protein
LTPAQMNLYRLALRQRAGDPEVTAELFAAAVLAAHAPAAPPGAKPCCQDARNLRVADTGADRVTHACVVCGCRHFRVLAEPKQM